MSISKMGAFSTSEAPAVLVANGRKIVPTNKDLREIMVGRYQVSLDLLLLRR